MITSQICCDNCHAHHTRTGGDSQLAGSSVGWWRYRGKVDGSFEVDPLPCQDRSKEVDDKHFCRTVCLVEWIAKHLAHPVNRPKKAPAYVEVSAEKAGQILMDKGW